MHDYLGGGKKLRSGREVQTMLRERKEGGEEKNGGDKS